MLGEGIGQGAVVQWRGGAENGPGELAIAVVAGGLDLEVQTAAAAGRMA